MNVYEGVWGVMTRWFRVPDRPPTLPVAPGEPVESFRPSEGFLRYIQFRFWLGLVLADAVIIIACIAMFAGIPVIGFVLAPLLITLAIFLHLVAYVAVYLRFDTTWYVMTRRSLRIRRGIWVIHETTITFENIQNISVEQGPLQRHFGIADVVVETAGGGAVRSGKGGEVEMTPHGLIEGIADAKGIRDKILEIVRQSKSAGLGDERHIEARGALSVWSPQQISVLREIRDAIRHDNC